MSFAAIPSCCVRAVSGDLTVFGGPALTEEVAARIRAEQFNGVLRNTPWIMLAMIFNAAVLVASLWQSDSRNIVTAWAVFVIIPAAFVLAKSLRAKAQPKRPTASRRAMRVTATNAAVFGALWALVPILFLQSAPDQAKLIIATLCAGMMCAGAFALGSMPVAAIIFADLILGGSASALLRMGDPFYALFAALLFIFACSTARSAIDHATLLAERAIAQFEGDRQRDVIGSLLLEFETNATDFLWETDAAGRIKHASARLAALSGHPASELHGRSYQEVLVPGMPELAEAAATRAELALHLAERTAFRNIVAPVTLGGCVHWWALTGKPVHGADGTFLGFRGFGADVTEVRVADAKIRRMALYDSLTDLPNRAWFGNELEQATRRLAEGGAPFAVMCLDLDHFKSVNDTQGHPTGDALLVEVARRPSACIGEAGMIARLGGDEFGVVQTQGVSLEATSELAKRMNEALSTETLIDGVNVATGVSIGIAIAPTDGAEVAVLLKHADLALYRAKAEGRGGFRFFEPGMDAKAKERRALEIDLRSALPNGELMLVYQPLIDLGDDEIKCCEALLRWNHPVRGLVQPMDFIPLAEETGLIQPIGEWVIREACRAASGWPEHIGIAVNLSAVQFHSPGIVAAVQRALEETGLKPERLELEVTETVLIAEMDRALAILNTLRQMKVRIALDDFGTGYSSLSYLRKLPFDKIKIDRSFVRDLATHAESQAIVGALIGLAGDLGVSVTAEGVETQDQLAHLRASGCEEAQGFLISKPQSATGIAAFIAQSLVRRRSAA
ncbi:PAS domain S-box-containing protein/diguanylate cyclase (GGDEF) domain-containing protein [Rhizobiales bacterium GAS113]|nr:PAS domain S-box-containing protein/diguanylate cyclase (GGDEF) domain-containing protein [Rhizobiales bacterium GAS113]